MENIKTYTTEALLAQGYTLADLEDFFVEIESGKWQSLSDLRQVVEFDTVADFCN